MLPQAEYFNYLPSYFYGTLVMKYPVFELSLVVGFSLVSP